MNTLFEHLSRRQFVKNAMRMTAAVAAFAALRLAAGDATGGRHRPANPQRWPDGGLVQGYPAPPAAGQRVEEVSNTPKP